MRKVSTTIGLTRQQDFVRLLDVLDLTHAELAHILGISRSNVSRYSCGMMSPPDRVLLHMEALSRLAPQHLKDMKGYATALKVRETVDVF